MVDKSGDYGRLKSFRWTKIAIVIVVIALVIGGTAVFLFYTQRSFDNLYNAVDFQVDNCMDFTIKRGILYSLIYAGNDDVADIRFPTEEYDVNYAYLNGALIFPDDDQVRKNLQLYVDRELPNCLKAIFSTDAQIIMQPVRSSVTFKDGITLHVANAGTVQGTLFGRDLKDNEISVDADMKKLLDAARRLAKLVGDAKGQIGPSVIDDEDLSVSFRAYPEQKTIVVFIQDESQVINGIKPGLLMAIDAN